MTAQHMSVASAPAVVSPARKLDRAAAGFGVAAGLAILFNSLLVAAWASSALRPMAINAAL